MRTRYLFLVSVLACEAGFARVQVLPPPTIGAFSMKVPGGAEVPVRFAEVRGGYAVVISRETWEDAGWKEVARGLAVKRRADVVVYDGDVTETRDALARISPRYTCFVAAPSEAGRQFVVAVHRLTRRLNDDPYGDTIWGILTGCSPRDAARIVAETRPLVVRKVAAGTPVDLELFDEGVWFDEGRKGHKVVKEKGGRAVDAACPDDSTASIVEALNTYGPDLFITSGHATERDWQIGYSYRNGQLRCRDGRLFGVDTTGKTIEVESPNPKVYLPSGNCLMGHVADDQSMALAWMGSGGVRQMTGYTVETWYGYAGWGVNDYFLGQPGRFSLAESFFLNQQALLSRLESRYPDKARFDFEGYGPAGGVLPRLARDLGTQERDLIGLMWDRDVAALYGDPAWNARLAPRALPWTQTLSRRGDKWTFTIRASADSECPRPPAALLPERIGKPTVTSGQHLKPVVTGLVVMMTGLTKVEKGKTYTVTFTAATTKPQVKPGMNTKPTAAPVRSASQAVPEERRTDIRAALSKAGPNRKELTTALRTVKPDCRNGMAFLLANMPEPDLKTLTSAFLVRNVELAYRARRSTPWGLAVPPDIFLNDVLPYASINERRDDWRPDFHKRFAPLVARCKSPGEAAVLLNREVFKALGVQYHATKRPKPDQSPYESTAAGYASCTGLSVLLVDACRAVGVPARIAGTAQWTGQPGNHTWVEVWDNGWHFIGAAEGGELDRTWFNDRAREADPSRRETRIYATSFKRTGDFFPMVWAPGNTSVPADDVTARYRALQAG